MAKRYFEYVLSKKDEIADYLMIEVPRDMAEKDAADEGIELEPEGPYYRRCFSSKSSIGVCMKFIIFTYVSKASQPHFEP